MNEPTLVPREEMNDLDWLARNVHVWPAGDHQPWCYVYWKGGQRAVSGNCITVIQPCVRVEMLDWLARRAELQNKPRWGKHGWPQIFQNEDGHWFGARAEWDFKAHISGGWKGDGVSLLRDDGECLRSGTILGDWRDTLEKRQEGNMRSMSGVHSNGDMEKLLDELNDIDESIFGDGFIPKDATTAKKPEITPSKYTKTIHGASVDVYDVLQAWGVSNPALQHLIKKALQCGQRGHKDNAQDLQDIIDSAIRAKELES